LAMSLPTFHNPKWRHLLVLSGTPKHEPVLWTCVEVLDSLLGHPEKRRFIGRVVGRQFRVQRPNRPIGRATKTVA
jgi:hypothetical protein